MTLDTRPDSLSPNWDIEDDSDEPQYKVERRRHQSVMWRWLTWLFFAVLTVAILGAGAVGWWYLDRAYPPESGVAAVDFTVTDGDTVQTVIDRLYENGLIADPEVFQWYIDQQGGLELTPGYYELPGGAHMGDVLERLRTPPNQTYRKVTFPEGYTTVQMAARLEEKDPLLNAGTFEQVATDGTVTSRYSPPGQPSLEGLLFPDTYDVSNADNEGQIVERMASRMERVAAQEGIDDSQQRLGMTPYQILTIASIIEREAKVAEDRPKIARVIYNRLGLEMNLEIDATLFYGQPGFEGSFADLRAIDTPYNSYMHPGLPPTPIANPGRASVAAALNPAPNPSAGDPVCQVLPDPTVNCLYLYYVLGDEEGRHVFAATPEQHEINVAAARAKGLL